MLTEYKDIYELLKGYFTDACPALSEEPNWPRIMRLSMDNIISGMLGYVIYTHTDLVDEDWTQLWKQHCDVTCMEMDKKIRTGDELKKVLDKAGIQYGIVKGFWLKDMYLVSNLRYFSDIDIIISLEDRKTVDHLMRELGFENVSHKEPEFKYVRDGQLIEIHTSFFKYNFKKDVDVISYYKDPFNLAGVDTKCLKDPEYQYVYTFVHLAKHVYRGEDEIRRYLDFAALLMYYGEYFDWNWVADELKKLNLYQFHCAVMTILERYIGISIPFAYEPVSDQTAEHLAEIMLTAVEERRNADAFASVKLIKASDGDTEQKSGLLLRVRSLLRIWLVPRDNLEYRYPKLKEKPYLMPYYRIRMLWMARKNWKVHVQLVKSILTRKNRKIDKMLQFHKEIGL